MMTAADRFRTLTLALILGVLGLLGPLSEVPAQQFGIDAEEDVTDRPPDPARGKTLFRTCLQCHSIAPDEVKVGPSLSGVVGRRPGSVPDFGYSQDMIDFGQTGRVWDLDTLDRFLTRPRAMFAGTKMVFWGFDEPEDRADVIAYLTSLRG